MCFKYFPPRATASPLPLDVTIAGSTMKNSWWVILSSFTCFWIREYNWICTLHGTHRIPEHYFQMIVILFYLLQTMPGDWVHFAFIFFILNCPIGIFNHWTLSIEWFIWESLFHVSSDRHQSNVTRSKRWGRKAQELSMESSWWRHACRGHGWC